MWLNGGTLTDSKTSPVSVYTWPGMLSTCECAVYLWLHLLLALSQWKCTGPPTETDSTYKSVSWHYICSWVPAEANTSVHYGSRLGCGQRQVRHPHPHTISVQGHLHRPFPILSKWLFTPAYSVTTDSFPLHWFVRPPGCRPFSESLAFTQFIMDIHGQVTGSQLTTWTHPWDGAQDPGSPRPAHLILPASYSEMKPCSQYDRI